MVRIMNAATLYIRGMAIGEIARTLGKPYPIIQADIDQAKAGWIAVSKAPYELHLAEELARIDHLERTYWEAWESSTGRTEPCARDEGGRYAKGKPLANGQPIAPGGPRPFTGNPSYLKGVADCQDRRAKLIGLYAPIGIRHSGEIQTEMNVNINILGIEDMLKLRSLAQATMAPKIVEALPNPIDSPVSPIDTTVSLPEEPPDGA